MKNFESLLLAVATVPSFDDGDPNPNPNPDPNPNPPNPNPNPNPEPKKTGDGTTFTQDDVNKFLAEDRRKHQAKLEATEAELQKVLSQHKLTDEQRGNLETSLEDLRKQLRTKEQQAQHEKQQLESDFTAKIAATEEAATKWEKLFRENMITRELKDAAVAGDAYNADQFVELVRGMTRITEENGQYKVVVDFPDIDPNTKESVMTLRTPGEVVTRMKELTDKHGNLFRKNVVSGIGGGSATGGVTPGKDGKYNAGVLAKKDPDAFRKMLRENPEALGISINR